MWLWKFLGLEKQEQRAESLSAQPPSSVERDPELERIVAAINRKWDQKLEEYRQEQSRRERSKPRVISDPNDDSPFLLLESEGGAVMLMDRETFDYMYGESSAPDPAQRDLDSMLPTVTRVRALACGMYRGQPMSQEVVLDTSEAVALGSLREALQILEDPSTFNHCACLGGPTLEFYSGQDLVATIGLQHGRAIRWKRWKHDARLKDGRLLNRWLTENGIDPVLLELLFHNQYDGGGLRHSLPKQMLAALVVGAVLILAVAGLVWGQWLQW